MGYDITFHPVSRQELVYYVLEVFADPALAADRVRFLTHSQQEERYISEGIYGKFSEFRARLQQGDSSAANVSFAAAAIAGYLHPYWHSRGGALTLLSSAVGLSSFFTPLHKVLPEAFPGMQCNRWIEGNYTASGYVYPEQIADLRKACVAAQREQEFKDAFEGSNKESLLIALEYCEQNGTGLIEAADIYVPISGRSYTDPANLRASFAKNLRNFRSSRQVRVKMRNVEELKRVLREHRAEIERKQVNLMVDSEVVSELDYDELELLATKCSASIHKIFPNPSMPIDIILKVIRGGVATGIANVDAAAYAAANPLLPSTVLAELAPLDHCTLQVNVAANPSTPPEVLEMLRVYSHKARFPALRRHIAGNPNASAETIAMIAKDKHKPTRDLARAHPKYGKK